MNIFHIIRHSWLALLLGIITACSSTPPPDTAYRFSSPQNIPKLPASPFLPGHLIQGGLNTQYSATTFERLPDWQKQSFSGSLNAFRRSCQRLQNQPQWQAVCAIAAQTPNNNQAARRFFEDNFTAWTISQNQQLAGTVTGYYEPAISGSLTPTAQARFPIYGIPRDFISVPLPSQYRQNSTVRIQPQGQNAGIISNNGMYLANLKQFPIDERTTTLKGRFVGRNFVPYYNRAQINAGAMGQNAPILAYANDPVELFFLQVQGSGRLINENGESMRLAFADKNNHPYRSIGRYMAQKGYLKLQDADMHGIKDWLRQHPQHLAEVLGHNPSFVFFRSLSSEKDGPIGALGVPLSAEISAAIDKHHIPLGAPVFVATTDPRNSMALNRLMVAQDTGSAIIGAVRIDFFWGFGDQAGEVAGKMKYPGYVWLLLPNGITPQYQP